MNRGQVHLGGSTFDLAVDLGAEKQHEAGDVKPREQNDDRAEGAVGKREAGKVMEVDAEAQGAEKPAGNADGATGREPMPSAGFDIRRPVVDDGEGQGEKNRCNEPADHSRRDGGCGCEQILVDGSMRQRSEEVAS